MSDETTVKEPRTHAGKQLLRLLQAADRGPLADTAAVNWSASIWLIEADAQGLAMSEVRAAVEGLPTVFIKVSGGGKASVVARAAVLALIDHISEDK